MDEKFFVRSWVVKIVFFIDIRGRRIVVFDGVFGM